MAEPIEPALVLAAAVRSLIDSLPRCMNCRPPDLCDRPATWVYKGAVLSCDEHAGSDASRWRELAHAKALRELRRDLDAVEVSR